MIPAIDNVKKDFWRSTKNKNRGVVMAYLLVCVRQQTDILHHGIYSRDLSPVKFDTHAVGIALRIDPCFNSTQYFVICCDNFHAHPTSYKNNQAKCTSQMPKLSFIHLDIEYVINAHLPADVAYHSFQAFSTSKHFRKSFIHYLRTTLHWQDLRDKRCLCRELYTSCTHGVTLPRSIQIVIEPPAVKVCKAWCHRLEGLVKKREFLEETMAWLSTLGGGYSSLGDYFRHFSVRAGEISIQQFRIALEMGDPVMVSKCRLFYAQSLMQLGPLRMSKLMIRQEFHTARYVLKDQKLVDMCKGMWSKLQFCYAKKRVKPTSSSDVHNGVTLAR